MPLASPVPIYLGCAGLIVGSLGLGAHHLLGGDSTLATGQEQPLFARSVEEASLPATGWPSPKVGVAHYEPMVELLTTPSRSTQPSPAAAPQPSQTAEPQQQEQRTVPREVVRDLAQQQTRPSRRARHERNRDNANNNEEATAAGEQRRADRRYRDRDDAEAADTRTPSNRRRVEIEDERPRAGERRVIIREEPEQRIVRGAEQRDGGFTPFRLFGIFDR